MWDSRSEAPDRTYLGEDEIKDSTRSLGAEGMNQMLGVEMESNIPNLENEEHSFDGQKAERNRMQQEREQAHPSCRFLPKWLQTAPNSFLSPILPNYNLTLWGTFIHSSASSQAG